MSGELIKNTDKDVVAVHLLQHLYNGNTLAKMSFLE